MPARPRIVFITRTPFFRKDISGCPLHGTYNAGIAPVPFRQLSLTHSSFGLIGGEPETQKRFMV